MLSTLGEINLDEKKVPEKCQISMDGRNPANHGTPAPIESAAWGLLRSISRLLTAPLIFPIHIQIAANHRVRNLMLRQLLKPSHFPEQVFLKSVPRRKSTIFAAGAD
jgi:hypothetical protein